MLIKSQTLNVGQDDCFSWISETQLVSLFLLSLSKKVKC